MPGPALDHARRVFGRWYRERWKTQVEAAKALGVNQSVISDFTNGKQGLGGVLIAAIAQQDADIALDMLGVRSTSERLRQLQAALTGEETGPVSPEWAAKAALATAPVDATMPELVRIARGFIALADLVGGAASSADSAAPTRGRPRR